MPREKKTKKLQELLDDKEVKPNHLPGDGPKHPPDNFYGPPGSDHNTGRPHDQQPPSGLPVLNPSELVTTFDSIVAAQNPFDEHHQGHHPQGYPGQQMPPGPGMHNMGGMHGPPYSMHNKMGPGMGMMRMPMPGQNGPPSHPNTGKTYPPDQPMVFNAANPNAPPIYPCGVCHKEVHDNDQAILCESGCNFWFHRICTGLSEPAYQMLTKEVYAEWVCDSCLSTKSIPLVKMKP